MGKTRSSKSTSTEQSSQKTVPKVKVIIDDTLYTESDMSLSMDNSLYSTRQNPLVRYGKEEEISKDEDSQQIDASQDETGTQYDGQTKEQNMSQSKIQENAENQQQRSHSVLSVSIQQAEHSRFLNQLSARAELSLMSIQKQTEQDYTLIDIQALQIKMKAIDDQIRFLNAYKNRLKYLLRKREGFEVEGQLQPIAMKACSCCNKQISKLCFRCEHLYCKAEYCARKKKQILNARMLRKLKENKQTGTKKEQLKGKKERKAAKRQLPEVRQEQSVQYDQSSTQQSQDSQIPDQNSVSPLLPLKKQEELQESSIDISRSSFFTFTSQKSNIFYDPDEQ